MVAHAAAAAAGQEFRFGTKVLSVDQALEKLRWTVGPREVAKSNQNAMAFGTGTHMGCDVSWTFIWRPGDGAFYEEVRSPHLTYKWGYDGGLNSQCWEVDPSGVSKVLEKDDHEASLLGGLIKSGAWLVPELAEQRLEIWLETPPRGQAEHWELDMPDMPPVATTITSSPPSRGCTAAAAAMQKHPPAAGGSSDSSGWQDQRAEVLDREQQQQQPLLLQQVARQQEQLGSLLLQQQRQAQQQQGSNSSSPGAAGGPVVASFGLQGVDNDPMPHAGALVNLLLMPSKSITYWLAVKLKGGRMLARVRVNGNSFHPEGYSHPLCSDTEVWRYKDWRTWSHEYTLKGLDMSVWFPREVEHELFEGCCHRYNTLGAKLRGPEIHKAYTLPASPPVPIDAQFMDHTYSQHVPVWQTAQGHLLVEVALNGRRAGWMILDTGASGFVIEPGVADQFKLPKFGNLRIAGVAGKVKTCFRRASQLRIGPLSLSDPVMMEMKIGRLVRHFHDRVIGIAGFDVFRRCRITLPCTLTRKALTKAHSVSGRVMPTVSSSEHSHLAALWPGSSSSSSSTAAAQNLQQVQHLQQQLAQVTHAADAASSACPAAAGSAVAEAAVADSAGSCTSKRRGSSSAKAAVASVEAAAGSSSSNGNGNSEPPPGRRRRRESSSSKSGSSRRRTRSSTATAAAAAAPAAAATADAERAAVPTGSGQQQQPLRELEQVEVPALSVQERMLTGLADNFLIELLVQRPRLIAGPHELEDGYVWQDLVMIASLPHVKLEFVAPRTGRRHESLFLVDSGAGGTEMMFHSRAAKELELLTPANELPGWCEPHTPEQQERYVSGVGCDSDGGYGGNNNNSVTVQAGNLPELVIRGQAGSDPGVVGSLVLREVRALFSTSGGLDISLYSAGMICVDLLSRMQVVLDYPNKRIGWKVPVPAPPKAPAAAAGETASC